MNKERIIQEFFELVRIASESKTEREIADVLKEKLRAIGGEVHEDKAGEAFGGNAGNVFAFFPGTVKDAPSLMLSAHMDTVVPGVGVEPILENGIIHSKNHTILGSDDKSGLVGVLEGLRIVQEEKIPHGDIQVVLTVAEEIGLLGAKEVDPKLVKADFGYALDSGGSPGVMITITPGQYRIVSVFKGRTAHAGVAPEEGLNAIVMAAKAIAQVKDGRMDDETTCNIGVIAAGEATNIVPDVCTVTSEARSRSAEKLEALVKEIKETFERVAKEFGGEVEVKLQKVFEPFALKESDPVIAVATAAAKNLNLTVSLEGSGGGSDANIFNSLGVPTSVLGTGMSKVHTLDEYVTEQDLYDLAAWTAEIIKETAKR